MKVARNAPCPCGSGNKYKKCCLKKDEEAERTALQAKELEKIKAESPKPAPVATKEHESSAEEQAVEQFLELEDDAKIAFCEERLRGEQPMDDDLAFEMFCDIHDILMDRGESERFLKMLHTLRDSFPEIYAKDEHFYLEWAFEDSFVTGDLAVREEAALARASCVSRAPEGFAPFLQRLAFHDGLPLLVKLARIAYPVIKHDESMREQRDEFAYKFILFEIFTRLEEHPNAPLHQPEFIEQIAYLQIDPKRLDWLLAQFESHTTNTWTREAFFSTKSWTDELIPSLMASSANTFDKEMKSEADFFSLMSFGVAFVQYLKKEKNIPYPIGGIALYNISLYLVMKSAGILNISTPSRNKQNKPENTQSTKTLWPDKKTLIRFLEEYEWHNEDTLYDVVALRTLLPEWIQFLAIHQLLDETTQKRCLDVIKAAAEHSATLKRSKEKQHEMDKQRRSLEKILADSK